MKTKTLIFILVIFAIILGGLFGVYYFFLADKINKDSAISDGDGGIKSIFDNFFPFGNEPSADQTGAVEGMLDEMDADTSVPRLRQISSFPVAGEVVFEDEKGETFIRFIARETGHIYETTTNSLTQQRITNTTIPRIQNALWASNGKELIVQYIDDDSEQIESFYAAITDKKNDIENSVRSLVGTFLPKNIISLNISSDGDKLFYLIKSGNGSVGIVSNLDGSSKVQVFNSPLSEWLVQWQRENTIALTTKPSAGVEGFLYFLNLKTEKFDKVLNASKGLTASVSPDGKLVLFAHNVGTIPILSVLNIGTGEIKDLPFWTMPEKCDWSEIDSARIYCGVPNRTSKGVLPDIWYQGIESFSDNVWIIDAGNGVTDLVVEPQNEYKLDLDITNLSLSPDEEHLLFINKKDSTLWSLELR
jgi:hypothetical protein